MSQSPGPVNMEIAREHRARPARRRPGDRRATRRAAGRPGDRDRVRRHRPRRADCMVTEATGISATRSTVPVGMRRSRASGRAARSPGSNRCSRALASRQLAVGQTPRPTPAPADAAPSPARVRRHVVPTTHAAAARRRGGGLDDRIARPVALGQYDLPLPLDGRAATACSSRATSTRSARSGRCRSTSCATRSRCARSCTARNARCRGCASGSCALASAYVGAYEVQPDALEEQFAARPRPVRPVVDVERSSSLADPGRAARRDATPSASSRCSRSCSGSSRCSRATPMSSSRSLGERMVTSHGRIDEALRRHRLERGEPPVRRPAARPRARPRSLRAGVAFCRGVMERSGRSTSSTGCGPRVDGADGGRARGARPVARPHRAATRVARQNQVGRHGKGYEANIASDAPDRARRPLLDASRGGVLLGAHATADRSSRAARVRARRRAFVGGRARTARASGASVERDTA